MKQGLSMRYRHEAFGGRYLANQTCLILELEPTVIIRFGVAVERWVS